MKHDVKAAQHPGLSLYMHKSQVWASPDCNLINWCLCDSETQSTNQTTLPVSRAHQGNNDNSNLQAFQLIVLARSGESTGNKWDNTIHYALAVQGSQ